MTNSISQKFTLTSLFRFSLPSILLLILTSLYTAVDVVFVSRFVGSDALSAINILLPLDSIIIGLSIMFGTGGSAIIGFKLGAGREQEAKENFALITITAIVTGAVVTVLFVLFLPSVIPMLGASDRLFPYCTDYGYILVLFAVPYILQVMFNSLFITAGKPNLALAVTAIAGVMNLGLDYLFIVIFKMGISGAAWGTALSRAFGGLFPVIYFMVNKKGLHFCRPKPDWKVIGRTITNGSSEMVSNIASGVTTFLFNITMMKLLGEDGVAAMTIVLYTQFIYSSVYFGFSNSCAPVISYNYGSGNTLHLKKLFRYCLFIIGGSTVLMLGLSFFAARPLIALFTPAETSVFPLAYHGYVIFIWNFLFAGINVFASSLFSAFSNGGISALISFLRTFVFIIGSLMTLPSFLGVDGLWLAVPVAEALTGFIAVPLMLIYGKRTYSYL